MTWRDLGLRGLAPYMDQVLSQPVAGRSSGDIKLRWSAAGGNGPPEAAPALRLSMDHPGTNKSGCGTKEPPASGSTYAACNRNHALSTQYIFPCCHCDAQR